MMYADDADKRKFWATCLCIAREHPELDTEEVERRAVLSQLGLHPI